MNVLVVDDQADSLTVVRLVLEMKGYSVLTTSEASEAIRTCKESGISVLISDLILHSSTTGTELALQVHQSCPDTAILFMSGTSPEGWSDADFENLKRFLPVRADFLQKPFTAKKLLATVERLVNAQVLLPEFISLVRDAERFRRSRQLSD